MGSSTAPMTIVEVGWLWCSVPLDRPVRTSFGTMCERHTLLVTVITDDGTVGLGETWTNFPSWAPRERIATLEEGVRPLVRGRTVEDVRAFTTTVLAEIEPLARQWGARGPLYQAVSGLDIALWDAAARRSGRSIAAMIADGSEPGSDVRVYASGLGPVEPARLAERLLEAGIDAFKLKVGFGARIDERNLADLRAMAPNALLAVDANQGWTLEEALAFREQLERYDVAWVEEPLPIDDLDGLIELSQRLPQPISLGENAYGCRELSRLVTHGIAQILQPDVAKNGGISAALDVFDLADEHGIGVVPHYLGGAIGQIASVHLVAGRAPDTLLELDANPNPLREELLVEPIAPVAGRLPVPRGPGLGVEIDADVAQRLMVGASADGLPPVLQTAALRRDDASSNRRVIP